MRRRTGFTLVELLIVISIIAMLVGMLMPALGRAREITRRGVCKANLHSLGGALNTYATGHNSYPDLYHDRGGAWLVGGQVRDPAFQFKGNSCNMYALIRESMIETEAFICPSTDHYVNYQQNPGLDDDFLSYENVSYSMHVQRPEQSANKNHNPLRLTSDTSMPMLADRTPLSGNTSWAAHSGGFAADPTIKSAFGGITDSAGESNAQRNSYNHNRQGQNIVYRDGHAAWSATSNAGIDGDNIWTWNDGTDVGSVDGRYGGAFRDACAATRRDSFLFP